MTLSRRRPPTPFPTAPAALAASGAGRWVLQGGVLRFDAAARRLVGTERARWALADWLQALPEASAGRLQHALDHDLHLALPVTLAAGAVLLSGGRGSDAPDAAWSGVVVGLPQRRAADDGWSERDEFFASVSHELRTPLNAIVGFTRLARAMPEGASARQHVIRIDEAAQVMLRVVNDLLDLARLDAGRLEILPDQPLHLPALLSRVGAMASALRQHKPIRLYASVDPACPARLRGDWQRIKQVLLNLVANAMRFTDVGVVALQVRLRRIDGENATLRFSVADTGAGMVQDRLDQLGQPFQPGRSGGSGLGLAVVKRLLELHGASLHVASVPGGGTTAWFDLSLLLDVVAPEETTSADTVVFSDDSRLVECVATQWRARGQALLPRTRAARARRWVVDMALPDAAQRLARGAGRGCIVLPVQAGPVPADGEPIALALLADTAFGDGAAPVDPAETALPGLRVLVLEDNPLNQLAIGEALRQWGAEPTIAGDGRTALSLVQQKAFDVALFDIQLPGESGLDTARRLRQMPQGQALPLIFLSAHLDTSDALAANALGALHCLVKPHDPATLLGLLRSIPAPARKPSAAPTGGPAAGALLALFKAEWPRLRPRLEAPVDAADLLAAVHSLRGALAVMGQPMLLAQARELEGLLRAGRRRHGAAVQRGLQALMQQADQLAAG